MDAPLSIPEIERLVVERARAVDLSVTADQVRVYENPSSTDDGTLIVQIVAKRPDNRNDWICRRLRFSQAVRDALVQRGDDRFPLIEVFAPEEWAERDDRP
jgi:hypothetical protein